MLAVKANNQDFFSSWAVPGKFDRFKLNRLSKNSCQSPKIDQKNIIVHNFHVGYRIL